MTIEQAIQQAMEDIKSISYKETYNIIIWSLVITKMLIQEDPEKYKTMFSELIEASKQ